MTLNDHADAEATADARVDEGWRPTTPASPFKTWFAKVAMKVSEATGSAWTFAVAILLIGGWVVSGPLFGFSDTWQLIANTFTTLVTFLMVFLIQNTQNRGAKATQLKLDELIRAVAEAHNELIDAEDDPEEQVSRAKQAVLAEKHNTSGHAGNGEPAAHQ